MSRVNKIEEADEMMKLWKGKEGNLGMKDRREIVCDVKRHKDAGADRKGLGLESGQML